MTKFIRLEKNEPAGRKCLPAGGSGPPRTVPTFKYRMTVKDVSNRRKTVEVKKMPEEKKKKGFLSAIKKSMDKSGGCCGAGETCGAAPEPSEGKEKKKTQPK